MEPEDQLPCSQEPTTGPYPEPNESNPHFPIPFLRYILIPQENTGNFCSKSGTTSYGN
jgi:hypothetical protein